MKKRRRHSISAVLFLVIALLLLFVYTKSNTANSDFRWNDGDLGGGSVQVETGKTVLAPFEFTVNGDVAEIDLSIRDASWMKKGVLLKDAIVPVKNGRVSSEVIMNVPPEAGVEPGHYYLIIVARDRANGNIVHEGKMPFSVDMLDLIWKCSC